MQGLGKLGVAGKGDGHGMGRGWAGDGQGMGRGA